MQINEITEAIIGDSIEVHRHLGPGLLESAYEECLCHEHLLTYLRLGGWKVGLLINFNVPILKQGIRRRILALAD